MTTNTELPFDLLLNNVTAKRANEALEIHEIASELSEEDLVEVLPTNRKDVHVAVFSHEGLVWYQLRVRMPSGEVISNRPWISDKLDTNFVVLDAE